jgi:UDP-N-acetyl-2-amino-2-deoxyglucuronate dehydrogenase
MDKHLGIIGGGNISQTHLRAAMEILGVKIAAVYGQNLEKAKRIADQAGAVFYQDLAAFLKHRPMTAVLIGSPSGRHAEQGIVAAKHGLHVLVEKPLDVDQLGGDLDDPAQHEGQALLRPQRHHRFEEAAQLLRARDFAHRR